MKEIDMHEYIENIKRMIEIQMSHRPIKLIVNLVDEIPEKLIFDGDRIS
jgi:hypothetical protein